MNKTPYVFPIVGGRKVDHLKGNIDALGVELSREDILEIESAYSFDIGFPMSFMFGMGKEDFRYENSMSTGDIQLVKTAAHIDTVPRVGVIKPRKL